jgi:hypothetical protein
MDTSTQEDGRLREAVTACLNAHDLLGVMNYGAPATESPPSGTNVSASHQRGPTRPPRRCMRSRPPFGTSGSSAGHGAPYTAYRYCSPPRRSASHPLIRQTRRPSALDHIAPVVDRRRRAVVRSESDVVRFDDLVRMDEVVLGGEDVPAVAGSLGVGGSLFEQLGDVELPGRRRPLQLLRRASDQSDQTGRLDSIAHAPPLLRWTLGHERLCEESWSVPIPRESLEG